MRTPTVISCPFQSTLPRRERRYDGDLELAMIPISIHAPAKGATCWPRWYAMPSAAFQSTLPRRERRDTMYAALHHTHFNPRSREGSDYILLFERW